MNRSNLILVVTVLLGAAGASYGISGLLRVKHPEVPPTASASAFVAVSAPPPPPSASTPPEPVDRLLSRFSSLYKTDTKDARVTNIELGVELLNLSIFKPGEVWSFNKTVGPRTKENGFKEAPVLIMGEIFQDVGGGMCQVSSTVFAAALKAGFEIVRRQPHSRPSSYMPLGIDATVNYPEQCWEGKQDPNVCFDLQLKNPYDFPITIRTRTGEWDADEQKLSKDMRPDGPHRQLTVELWGLGPVAEVKTQWRAYATTDFQRRWRKGWKPGTWSKKNQSGKPGLRGALAIDIVWPDGHKTHSILISNYKPVDEVWWVGRDWEGDNPWE